MRTVMMYVGSFLLGFGMHSAAMDHASSMNQFYWDDLPPEFLAEVQEQEKKNPDRWSQYSSDSESEALKAELQPLRLYTEDKKVVQPSEFDIVGMEEELEKKYEQELKVASSVGEEESDASSSFEQDYVQQGMRQLSQNKGRRELARYNTLTVQTVNDDELKILNGPNCVYESVARRATHAAISPTHDQVTVACHGCDDKLFILTIPLSGTSQKAIVNELPLVILGENKVAISDIGELTYLSDNKVRVMVTACCTPPQEIDNKSVSQVGNLSR